MDDGHSSDSSSASLLHLDSKSSFAIDNLKQRSHSADQLTSEALVSHSSLILRHALPVLDFSSSDHPSSSSVDENNDGDDENDDIHVPDGLQYTRFDESPVVDASHECLMHSSIPRRREFSEQFRDLAQLHRHADVPRAKWDDASRLFPKQFGLSPSVAINIWKQVDSDADMMLTESEYCLAAHLASKYSATGFSLLASQHEQQSLLSVSKSLETDATSSPYKHVQQRQGRSRLHKDRQQRPQCGFDSDEDDSHDLLISPDLRLLDHEDDGSSRTPRTHDESAENEADDESEEEQEEDDRKNISDDEICVQALLPSSIHRPRPLADATTLLCDENEKVGGRVSSSSFSSSSSSSPSSNSQDTPSSVSQPSSSALMPASRLESACSVSSSSKPLDPVEVLAKFTTRSIEDIRSLTACSRRRLLASLVRAAKSTNYTLLRLNNELAGELQELCDQHTNLNCALESAK